MSCLSLLVIALVTKLSGSSVPFTVKLRREAVPVKRKGVVVAHKASYSGAMSLGQPAQEFMVVFDTGSGHVIVPAQECESATCLKHQRYDSRLSDTAIGINVDGSPAPPGEPCDEAQIGFGTGKVTGQFVRDKLCIGAASDAGPCVTTQVVSAIEMSKQPFSQFRFDGIIGLGLSNLAVSPEFSFLHNLAKAESTSSLFGVYLTDSDTGAGSEITFGGYNEARIQGNVSWVPVARSDMGYWQVEIVALRVGGKRLSVCKSGCHGIMDSGTSHLGIPGSHEQKLGTMLTVPANGLADCKSANAPLLEFELVGGLTLALRPQDYMRQLPLEGSVTLGAAGVTMPGYGSSEPVKEDRSTSDDAESEFWCRPKVMPVNMPEPMGPNLFLLGEPVLRRYYTTFDWEAKRIGFGVAAEAPDEADPLEVTLLQVSLSLILPKH